MHEVSQLSHETIGVRVQPMVLMKIRRVEEYEIADLEIRMKKSREVSPKSVTQLAADAGMSTANWYRIEKGEVKYLPEETLDAIESSLGVSLRNKPDSKDPAS